MNCRLFLLRFTSVATSVFTNCLQLEGYRDNVMLINMMQLESVNAGSNCLKLNVQVSAIQEMSSNDRFL